MKIATQALKLNRFKNLLSHMAATTTAILPLVVGVGMCSVSSPDTKMFSLGILTAVAQIPFFIMRIAFNESDFSWMKILHSQGWKEVFNKPVEILTRMEHEKLILMMRELSDKKTISQSDLEKVANSYAEQSLRASEFMAWLDVVRLDANHKDSWRYGTGQDNLKYEQSHQMMEDFLRHHDSPKLRELVEIALERQAKLLGSELHLNEYKSYVRRSNIGLYRPFPEDSRNWNSTQALFFSKYYVGLTVRDYKDIKKLIKESSANNSTNQLERVFELLMSAPEKVNWFQIKELVQKNYKATNDWYGNTLKEINKYVEKQEQKLLEQKASAALSSNVASTLTDSPTGIESTINGAANEALAPGNKATHLPYCEFVNYNPTYFPEKWSKIKKNYDLIRASHEQLDAGAILELENYLNSSLPILVKTDINFKTPQLKSEKALELLSANLDLAVDQTHELCKTLSDKTIKELKINQVYQTMKMSR